MRRGLVQSAHVLLSFLVIIFTCNAKKSKRWTYPRPQWPIPEHRMDPHPCQFFIWDPQSAVKFCECSRLLRSTEATSLWGDKHKQLWLRIPYTSRLLQLFPCQQHSLRRCSRCGHEYWEHVRWAAERRKNQPFEKLLASRASRGVSDEAPLDYRGASVLVGSKTTNGRETKMGAANNRASGSSGPGDWRVILAVVAEAQRVSTLQLSGISVTSAAARVAFKKMQDSKTIAGASKIKRVAKRR